jgi:hypothetical protein
MIRNYSQGPCALLLLRFTLIGGKFSADTGLHFFRFAGGDDQNLVRPEYQLFRCRRIILDIDQKMIGDTPAVHRHDTVNLAELVGQGLALSGTSASREQKRDADDTGQCRVSKQQVCQQADQKCSLWDCLHK